MKELFRIMAAAGIIATGVLAAPAAQATAAPALKVMSYNIKNTDDDANGTWNQRFAGIEAIINDVKPDVMGFTETDHKNTNSLSSAYVGTGASQYSRFPTADSANILMWQNSRFALASSGKQAFGTSCSGQNRNMVWVVLDDLKTSNVYFVVMTHLSTDKDGANCVSARSAEAQSILAAVDSRPAGSLPIVMGDMNNQTPKCGGTAAGAPIETLAAATSGHNLNLTVKKTADCTSANATFNASWDSSTANDSKRIDYIFADHSLVASKTGIDKRMLTVGGATKSPSDHYPIWAVLSPQ